MFRSDVDWCVCRWFGEENLKDEERAGSTCVIS